MDAGRGTLLALALSVVLGMQAAYADPPFLEAPPDVEEEAEWFFTILDLGEPTISVDPWTEYEVTNSAPPSFPVGTTVITWLIEDENGGRALDTQNVVVKDTTPPSCTDEVRGPFYSKTGKKIPVDVGQPAVTDLADLNPDVEVVSGERSKYPVGNSTVLFAATDDSGNTTQCKVTVVVAIPDIANLELEPFSDTISATWDAFEGESQYRAMLFDSSGATIRNAMTDKTEHVFSDLDPGSVYKAKISLQKYRLVDAEAFTTTLPLLDIMDGFDSAAEWSHVPTTFNPGFNRYVFSINQSSGNPAPSAQISGDGSNTNSRIEKWFDTSAYAGGPLYFGIDYRSEARLFVQFVVDTGDNTPRYVKSAWADGGGWTSHQADISRTVQPGDRARVQAYLYDVDDGGGHTLYVDNVVLSGINPARGFGAGSADAHDPEREAFNLALSRIMSGEADPSEYLGSLGAYDDLLRVVLGSLGIP